MKNTPLRDWGCASYDPQTGKPASAFGDGQSFSVEGMKITPSAQVEATRGRPGRGSPPIDWLNKNRSNGAAGDGDAG